ncbi:hypothetical protein IMZ48_04025 [Candidatus Bathyarchaeota archaeon]|nr:hypothetical protein [Candidatus Bathyarchaeota archaeon]
MAMDPNEEKNPALTGNWNPNVEDGVDSVDGDPEERAAEAGGSPGNAEGHAAEGSGAAEARGEHAAQTGGAAGNTGEHAPETGRAPGNSRGRARHAIIRDGPPPDSEWNSERHHGHQVDNPTHQCANVECTKGRQFLDKENRMKDTIIRRLERELKKKQEELDRKNRGPERQTERVSQVAGPYGRVI